MLLGILLTLHIIVCVALIGVVLLQRSEGGALGMGGGPTGFMTARGAGDLLTRITWILGTTFFVLSLALTLLAGQGRGASSVVDRLKIDAIDPNKLNQAPAPSPQTAPLPTSPNAAPGPITAPTPQVRNPFTGSGEQAPPTAPAPSNP